MSDGHKRILSPFTGCKKQKAWNQTREKYMPVKQTKLSWNRSRGIILRRGTDRRVLDSKGACYNGNESDDDESYYENNGRQQLPEGFVNSCYKLLTPILLQKLINDFSVCKHQKHCSGTLLLAEKLSHGLLAIYCVSVNGYFTTSKMELEFYYNKLCILVSSPVAEQLKT